MTDLREPLRERLLIARRTGDKGAVSTLRTVIAALDNAEAVPAPAQAASLSSSEHVAGAVDADAAEAPRRTLDEDEQRAVLAAEVADLQAALITHVARGDSERMGAARAGLAALDGLVGPG